MAGLFKGNALGLCLQIFGGTLLVASPVFYTRDFQKVVGPSGFFERGISVLTKASHPPGFSIVGNESFQSVIVGVDLKQSIPVYKVPHKQVRLEIFGFKNKVKSQDWILERITSDPAMVNPEVFALYLGRPNAEVITKNRTLSSGFVDLDPGINEFRLYSLEKKAEEIRGLASSERKIRKTFKIEYTGSP
jgi:hypothetical protein